MDPSCWPMRCGEFSGAGPLRDPGVTPKRLQRARLPYCTAESPVTGFIGGLRNGTDQDGETGWPGILALLGATAVLSVLLGRPAIVLSVLALLSSVAARLTWKRGKKPALLMALLGMAFPWALGATLGWTGDVRSRSWRLWALAWRWVQPSPCWHGRCIVLSFRIQERRCG